MSNRVTTQTADWVDKEGNAEGARFDSGPYIGIVKENRDPLMSGRLQIWIPEFGGIETDPKYWRTVSYASPFIGATYQEPFAQEAPKSGASDINSFKTVRHTYGMWYTTPDLENWVLCTFVGGDPARGYWFACVPNQVGHFMTPGIGASDKIAKVEDPQLSKIIEPGQPYPVAEFNEYDKTVNWSDIDTNKKPVHEAQLKILLEQGLDRKRLTGSRGIISSSSNRETPTGTFGVSTPGRPLGAVPDPNAPVAQRRVRSRRGGHTFVMDDGDKDGKNNLTRWRSAGGHQILMDDSENILYITNSTGTTYIEMDKAGHLNVYSSNSINFRTKKEFNLHADSNLNINVGGSFNLNVKGSMTVQASSITAKGAKDITLYGGSLKLGSDGRLDLYTSGGGSFTGKSGLMMTGATIGLNSGPGPVVSKPRDIALKSLSDTAKDGNGQWQVKGGQIKSVVTLAPTHEPWDRKSGVASSASNAVQDTSNDGADAESETPVDLSGEMDSSFAQDEYGQGGETIGGTEDGIGTSDDYSDSPGIQEAIETPVSPDTVVSEADMVSDTAPTITETVGPLNEVETKAVVMQVGKSMSDNFSGAINKFGDLGEYAASASKLVESGFISRSAVEQFAGNPNQALSALSSWTGKDGIKSATDFLSNPTAQASAVLDNLKSNYKELVSNGGILPTDPKGVVGGMISAGYSLGGELAKAARYGTVQSAVSPVGDSFKQLFAQGAAAVTKRGRGP